MSAINYFESLADYTSHVKSTDNSEMSLVTPKDLHYDGLNVENKHKIPAIGDCLYLDSNNQRHFFYGATVKNDILTSRCYTPVGVVAHKYDDNKIILVHKNELNGIKYCEAAIQKLSDFKIDGTANNIQVRWYNSSGTKTVIANTFTESCSSLQDFVTKFDTFLRANQVSSYDWHCELLSIQGVDTACVVIDAFTSTRQLQYGVIESGASATAINWELVGEDSSVISNILRNNGGIGTRIGVNKQTLIDFYQNHSSVDATDSITNANGIINKSDFDNNLYPTVKAYYGTYDKYIDSIMMQTKPCSKGGQVTLQDGETLFDNMKYTSYRNLNGETTYLFPACKTVADLTTGGLSWRLPDINEAYYIFSKIKNDASDAMNVGLYNMSGNTMTFFVNDSVYTTRALAAKCDITSFWYINRNATLISGIFPFTVKKLTPISVLQL